MFVDQYQRTIDYLRIGVTDKCNLRCRYCMPAEGIDFMRREDILSYEEIIRLSRIFSNLGVTKVRLTGGEPFVRKDIDMLLEKLVGIFSSVHITTNAVFIEKHIPLLKNLGISGLNISLDTLDRNKFHLITRRDNYNDVIQSIDGCLDNDIPIKINVVVMKGVNDDEIVDFVHYGMRKNIQIRFIEAMPFNEDGGNKDVYMAATEIESVIRAEFRELNKTTNSVPSSSIIYEVGSGYELGIIPAYSRSLCGTCNRIRLTPKGELLNCLYSKTGMDLLSIVRDTTNDDGKITELIRKSVFEKKKNGHIEEALRGEDVFRSMTTIGG